MDLPQRLEMLPRSGLPLESSVHVYWNEHQVPFIESQSDHDLAVTLGVVHVHLRWTQMELMRHIAQGRLSELVGPFGVTLDRAIRTLDLTRAVPEIVCSLPSATRDWVNAFVAGINHAVGNVARMPPEFRIFGLSRKHWTLPDVISVGRLAAFDVTWSVWHGLLRRDRSGNLDAAWQSIVGTPADLDIGSNSWAVAPSRTRSGAACIASDTHLPALLPNLWLIAGCRSPSYHVVGLMAPGIPAMLLGRNPRIAWGGTNLHAASSDLFDVARRPADHIRQRRERLRVRFAGTRELIVRDTELGPIVSAILRSPASIALRWMGHRPSDELTAMLGANRARNWQEFRTALNGIAVPGQNMTYADVDGHIGKLMAVHLPDREAQPPRSFLRPLSDAKAWDKTVRGSDLPASFDPAEGFVASANNRPFDTKVLVGYVFSSDHRIERLREALLASDAWDFASLAELQQDVLMPAALPIRDRLLAALRSQSDRVPRQLAEQLASWDGRYVAASSGPLLFELLLFHLGRALYGKRRLAGYSAVWNARELLFRDIRSLPPDLLARKLRSVMRAVQRGVRRYRCWGAMHRLEPRHVLAPIPIVGWRFRVTNRPAEGGSDTVLKTAHAMAARRHRAGLVSTARHISDLSDLDNNWFVLLGGQDGWPGATMSDQIDLWCAGRYITMPLRPETVRQSFRFVTELRP